MHVLAPPSRAPTTVSMRATSLLTLRRFFPFSCSSTFSLTPCNRNPLFGVGIHRPSTTTTITTTFSAPYSSFSVHDDSSLPPPPPPPPPHNSSQVDEEELLQAPTTSDHPPPPTSTPTSLTTTGAFQRVPMVAPSKEIIESALKRAERTGGNKKLKNEAARAKNRSARQLDALMKELTGPLGSYERGFPRVRDLHPFENALLELTVGEFKYSRALARVGAVRKATVEVSKGYAARASKAGNRKEAVALQVEGFSRVEAIFQKGADAVDELKEVAKQLRRLPVVHLHLPTVALVGAPNVGKSSLVQLLSSGLPEVQNYPFTTRSIKMGHFYVDGARHQVTDTPGLLNRGDEDRNAMEKLTLACLEYLPTAVLFVVDLTGECGTSVQSQWAIRSDLKKKFPTKPWLDVFSKADLLEEEFDEVDERVGRGEGEVGEVTDAIQFASALPTALRISSLTGYGIEELKSSMLEMLEQHELRVEQEQWVGGDGDGGKERVDVRVGLNDDIDYSPPIAMN